MTTARIFTDEEKKMYGNQTIDMRHKTRDAELDGAIAIGDGFKLDFKTELDGGGWALANEFCQAIKSRIGPVGYACEMFAGMGIIGFKMLGIGLCKRLALSDINPEAKISCCNTVKLNGFQDKVKVYESDCFDDIPESEQFELVIGNPPHFNSPNIARKDGLVRCIRTCDPGWKVHQKFYDDIILHLKPCGHILMCENILQSGPRDFIPMIKEVGLELEEVFTVTPNPDFYYMWSRKLYF